MCVCVLEGGRSYIYLYMYIHVHVHVGCECCVNTRESYRAFGECVWVGGKGSIVCVRVCVPAHVSGCE